MSHSQLDSLIKMLNQISANNSWHGETDAAAEKVAGHIHRFWARSMKEKILEYTEQDGAELSNLSKMAMSHLKQHAVL